MANHLIRKKRPLIIQPTTPARASAWPKWYYEQKTGRGAIFRSIDELPEGWVESYAKTDAGKAEAKRLAGMAGTAGSTHDTLYYTSQEGLDEDEELDADADTGTGDEPDELEDIDDIDVETIKQRLRARNIPFAARGAKPTLYQLLEENWIQE
jgi:hypothetical protein